MQLDIDPDVRRARTLPKHFYLDPAAWSLARERIFARGWAWLGDLEDVATAGSLSPRSLLPGLLDEPVLLARDGVGTLRCLSNVCTHRGNLLVHEACSAQQQIRCGYHSRRFDLTGRMIFMPGFDGACDFPSAADHLPPLAFAAWQGQGFASLNPATPLAQMLAPVEARLQAAGITGIAQWRHDPTRERTFEFDAHWALYVENYLEGLHIPFLHAGLTRSIEMADYRYELFPWCNLQLALARPDEPAFAHAPAPDRAPDPAPGSAAAPAGAGLRVAAYYFWIWPNLMLNFYPWGLSINLVLPLAPARTRVVFKSYVREPALLAAGAGGALDTVEMEDEAVVLSVQRGIRARLYERGRYSPQHERGVHHFHRLIAAAMHGS